MTDERTPETIVREIERTRAELADTIDAIADRVSPRRAATRTVGALRTQASAMLSGRDGAGRPAAVLDAAPAESGAVDAGQRQRAVAAIARSGGGATYTGTQRFAVTRELRTDRVLLAVGGVAAVAGLLVLLRSRKR
jgi:hypothetical protein